jgi:RNA polymerase sigma-70 factor (ECF subfamily)
MNTRFTRITGSDQDMPSEAAILRELPDDESMQRVASGDPEALAVLFDKHQTRVYRFLRHLVGEEALAEDLLGETFLQIYRARGKFRAGTEFTPWLFTVARNLARGELRKRQVRTRVLGWLGRVEATEVDPWQPEREAQAEAVRNALSALPEDQRIAVALKEYEGLSYREIGVVLGCTEEAARARTYRARQTLRTLLKEWGDD